MTTDAEERRREFRERVDKTPFRKAKAKPKSNGAAVEQAPRESQATVLIKLAESVSLFQTPDGVACADVILEGHRHTYRVRGREFRSWLQREFFVARKSAPTADAMQGALGVMEARARFDGETHETHIRAAQHDGRLYLDLCNAAWQAVEISTSGWHIVDNPPVRFRRARGMLPLPTPVPGGTVERLRPLLNLRDDRDFVLAVAYLLACLRGIDPFPFLVVNGEQGSAKSTFARILRGLVDPNTAETRALPREERDLFIAASNSFMLCFDNVSSLPAWLSDALCRLATGGGFAVRQLHTDDDEMLFSASRPALLNAITEVVTRPDLADRAIFVTLQPIAEEDRKFKTEMAESFQAEAPFILAGLLDAVVEGLKNLPDILRQPRPWPRLADFAAWICACEPALWPVGTFMDIYAANRASVVQGLIENDPLAPVLMDHMSDVPRWSGNASALLVALNERQPPDRRPPEWPKSARALSGWLRRWAPDLRTIGLTVIFPPRGNKSRGLVLGYQPKNNGGK